MPPGFDDLDALRFEQLPYDAIELITHFFEGRSADASFLGNDPQEVSLDLRFGINVDLQIGQCETPIAGRPAIHMKGQMQEGEMPDVDGAALVGIFGSPQDIHLCGARERRCDNFIDFFSIKALDGFPHREVLGDEVWGKKR
ncbi:hypothetical protein D3C77_356650 [compost metagenome]